ncbi:MAG: Arginine/ornithine antiporter ArcD [Myxococcaceae bacterium]|nr:Arginine/ornithine antiporter ArcD [Myxococcaceae bacterium]
MTVLATAAQPKLSPSASAQKGSDSPALERAWQRSAKALWSGRILSGLMSAFLLLDASMKLLGAPEAVKGTTELGYQASVVVPLGVIQLLCLALYLVPRTAVLGAILWTGYLGGAIATHVRMDNPLFSHVLFPIYVAAFLWAGVWLRDPRVRNLLAPTR